MTSRARKHPSARELSRATVEGLEPRVELHLALCAECAATWARLARVDALSRELPAVEPTHERSEETLAAILAVAATARPKARETRVRWWHFGLPAAFACAAAAVVIVVLARRDAGTPPQAAAIDDAGPTYRGAVRPHAGARFVRESAAPHEVVRLYEGTISVDVTQLKSGEQFVVAVADGTVESRGAGSFEASAANEKLSSVQVVSGTVDVKPAQRSQVVLLAGQRWDVEIVPDRATLLEDNKPTPVGVQLTRVPSVTQPAPNHAVDLPMAKLFDRGWKLYRAGKPRAAVTAFDEAIARYPRDPLAEDAMYWRGMALARSQRPAEAAGAFAGFLDRYPRSPRAGEVSAMLGWLVLEAGNVEAAERRFEAAKDDRVQTVRVSAEKGLAAVAATRAKGR